MASSAMGVIVARSKPQDSQKAKRERRARSKLNHRKRDVPPGNRALLITTELCHLGVLAKIGVSACPQVAYHLPSDALNVWTLIIHLRPHLPYLTMLIARRSSVSCFR